MKIYSESSAGARAEIVAWLEREADRLGEASRAPGRSDPQTDALQSHTYRSIAGHLREASVAVAGVGCVEVIDRLERVRSEAMAGQVSSIAIATVAPDLSTGSTFTLGDGTLAELLGSIDLMKHRMMRRAEDGPLD